MGCIATNAIFFTLLPQLHIEVFFTSLGAILSKDFVNSLHAASPSSSVFPHSIISPPNLTRKRVSQGSGKLNSEGWILGREFSEARVRRRDAGQVGSRIRGSISQ